MGIAEPAGIAEPLLEAHELYRFFHAEDDETFALRGVSFSIDAGEFVALVGPSGSGKSTLLACLAGLDEPDGGYVAVAGTRITRRPEKTRSALRARDIGILLQSGNLLEPLTIAQNVRLAQSLSPNAFHKPAREILSGLGIEDRSNFYPSALSGGEAARAGLAVALANDPAVLVADEPTGEVDSRNEENILNLLRERAVTGCAVLVASHSERVASAADRIVKLIDGRLVPDE